MTHIEEQDLIAYQLHEAPNPAIIAAHLEQCPTCAATAESIAETLRVFSAEPVPQPNLDHAWQRLRGNLPALAAQRKPRRYLWLAPIFAAFLVLAAILATHHQPAKPVTFANNHPGPLTNEPTNPAIATHIDSAERLLTEVNHTTGPVDQSTLTQAHALLLTNAVYVQQAHASGDLAQANLLENLGRVLTTLDHQPTEDKGWHIRFEMNTDGLLLDLRILQQNQKDPK